MHFLSSCVFQHTTTKTNLVFTTEDVAHADNRREPILVWTKPVSKKFSWNRKIPAHNALILVLSKWEKQVKHLSDWKVRWWQRSTMHESRPNICQVFFLVSKPDWYKPSRSSSDVPGCFPPAAIFHSFNLKPVCLIFPCCKNYVRHSKVFLHSNCHAAFLPKFQ